MKSKDPTRQEYNSFAKAYDFFNRELFESQLPPCYITLQRKANSRGYYGHEFFAHRRDTGKTSEIALNPVVFRNRSDAEILSTLVHEQVHHWQSHFGSPGRARYHNREWADKMESLGLMPSHTGLPGGKRTGQAMTHYIVANGPFDRACRKLLASGFLLNWQAMDGGQQGKKPGPDSSKVKHTCPACALNAWAKSGASILCGSCGEIMIGADGKTGDCPAYKNAQVKEVPTTQKPAVAGVAPDFEALTPGQLANNGMLVQGLQAMLTGMEGKCQTIAHAIKHMKNDPCWRAFVRNGEEFRYGPTEFRAFVEAHRPAGCHTPCHILERLLRDTDAYGTLQELLGIER